jgi:hypothetical protein
MERFGDEFSRGRTGSGAGLGAGVESNLLSESLALKAFLRVKREERKRNSSSDLFYSTPTSFTKDRSHYSLSYDPESSVSHHDTHLSSSIVEGTEDDESEEKKGSMMVTTSFGSTEDRIPNRSFNSMHAIINESFQEKIDYQRKLREQQSELLALKDKLHHLQVENSRLTKTTIKLNQRQLPLAFAQIMKIRRRSKVCCHLLVLHSSTPHFPPLLPALLTSLRSSNLLFENGSNSTIISTQNCSVSMKRDGLVSNLTGDNKNRSSAGNSSSPQLAIYRMLSGDSSLLNSDTHSSNGKTWRSGYHSLVC